MKKRRAPRPKRKRKSWKGGTIIQSMARRGREQLAKMTPEEKDLSQRRSQAIVFELKIRQVEGAVYSLVQKKNNDFAPLLEWLKAIPIRARLRQEDPPPMREIVSAIEAFDDAKKMTIYPEMRRVLSHRYLEQIIGGGRKGAVIAHGTEAENKAKRDTTKALVEARMADGSNKTRAVEVVARELGLSKSTIWAHLSRKI
jgi:hypothetical protein